MRQLFITLCFEEVWHKNEITEGKKNPSQEDIYEDDSCFGRQKLFQFECGEGNVRRVFRQ
jgi:hypothetical protein